jgi:AraC family transcriptional regulator of adaptative response/methylated-DNA-[protein]-cysteine methyltransferase
VNLSTNVRREFRFRSAHALPEGPIKYAIGRCASGKVLVASSVAGICAILLDEDAEALRGQLRAAFPSQHVAEAFTELEASVATVAAFIDGTACDSVVRLDIAGTQFQQRVWKALCSIPAGEVRTYTEVARSTGAARAVRAVAAACAANRLAVAIPCHRVIRSDGRPSGYRWGPRRKLALLAQEQP